MRQSTKRPVVVIELNLYDQDLELGVLYSAGLAFVPALGSYKGMTNRSYVLDIGREGEFYGEIDQSKLNIALDLASKHKQESVLMLDSNRRAQLYYIESQELVDLGQLSAIGKTVADASEAWTLVNGTYYGTEV